MKKRIIFVLGAVLAVTAGVAALSAFEAHIINVTATIENALTVDTSEIAFGTVFPQEVLLDDMTVSLSSSFLAEDRVDDVSYVINQKPKPRNASDAQYCHDNSPTDPGDPKDPYYGLCYPSLCEQLSKLPDRTPDPGNDEGVSAPHQPGAQAKGLLSKLALDTVDTWLIDLKVPCFTGNCDQAYDPLVFGNSLDPRLEHEKFGCDLWVEVTGISETPEATPEPSPTP